MNHTKILLTTFAAMLLLTAACKKEEVAALPHCRDAALHWTLNGKKYEAERYQCRLYKSRFSGKKALDCWMIAADSTEITLTVFDPDLRGDCPGKCIDTFFMDFRQNVPAASCPTQELPTAHGTVEQNGNGVASWNWGGKENGFIHISQCDPIQRRVSGSFALRIRDYRTNEVAMEVTEGVFEDMCYEIVE
ncbi:MAG: hypothetical protein D6730_10935 [Bacteroidetes bacterium]|nr:MAG: hypothetical protein D6730_10935 [Bacteroidota bacterium]